MQRFPTLDHLTPTPPSAPDPAAAARVADLLLIAERPAFYAEMLGRAPDAVAPFQELAELLAADVIAPSFRHNFPQPHPLRPFTLDAVNRVTSTADVLLVVDAPLPWIPGPAGPKAGAKVVWIDADPVQQPIPMWEYPADVRIAAGSTQALSAILAEVRGRLTPADVERLDARRARKFAEGQASLDAVFAAADADGDLPHITPRWVARQLDHVIDEDTIVLGEGGTLFEPGAPVTYLRRSRPGTSFFHAGAHLGVTLSAAIGAKLAAPDKRVVTLGGDGVYNFALASQSFWAAHHHKAPFVALIFNNRGYTTGTGNVRQMYPDGYAVRAGDYTGGFFDPPPDYVAEARAAGCHAEQVRRPGEVRAALERAFRAVEAQGVCAVVDIWLPRHITGEL